MSDCCGTVRIVNTGGGGGPETDPLAWRLTGNAGTAPISSGGTNGIGTTNAQDLNLVTDGQVRVAVSSVDGATEFYPGSPAARVRIASDEFFADYPLVDPNDSAAVDAGIRSDVDPVGFGLVGSALKAESATGKAFAGVFRAGTEALTLDLAGVPDLSVNSSTSNSASPSAASYLGESVAPGLRAALSGKVDVGLKAETRTSTSGFGHQTENTGTSLAGGGTNFMRASSATFAGTVSTAANSIESSSSISATDNTNTRSLTARVNASPELEIVVGDLAANVVGTIVPGGTAALVVTNVGGIDVIRVAPLALDASTGNYEVVI